MERKVGEIFEYNGEWYQCMHVPQKHSCKLCDLIGLCCDNNGVKIVTCVWRHREDNTSVIFKKLEKVGEPYMSNGHLMQTLSGEKQPNSIRDYKTRMCYYENCILRIEIKQNKEDMEEEKLNLKKFDLEAAKVGKPVCTRDGRKARIISFDRHGEDCPIIALVVDSKNAECEEVIDYTLDGICNENIINHNKYDLMMFTRKKEGWLNIFKDFEDTVCCVYPTEKEALEDGEIEKDYITTIKIEWEE
jgi:hypothetical protein